MDKFYQKLETLLKKDKRFLDQDGDLLKSEVTDKAYKADKKLIELLISQKEFKGKFFSKIKDVLVFNINDFVAYISDKNFLADSYTKYRNKIGLNIEGKFLKERDEVALVWPFKDCVLEGGMTKEDEKRKEIFFNEILAQDEIDKLLTPKVLTNWKRYTQKGTEKIKDLKRDENGIIRENLIIKGNNLLSLHSLKQQFQNKIKLIYIDPPYNTGTEDDTFVYNNNFKHSTWLTFMKNRLEVSRDLLRDNGFIAIAIDHAELYYLGVLADEVFDRENRVGLITILHNPKGRNQSKFFSANSEFMLIYSKNMEYAEFNSVAISEDVKKSFSLEDDEGKYRYEPFMRARTVWSRKNRPKNWYPIFVSKDLKDITFKKKSGYHKVFPITNDGKEMAWKNIKDSFLKLNRDKYFIAKQEKGKIRIYHKYREQQVLKNVWTDKKYQSEFHGTNLLKDILGKSEFSYPKSLYTVLDTVKILTSGDDIILDFFAGSGTTGHAILEANKDGSNRKFILVEQLSYIKKVTVERIKRVIKNLAKEKKLFSGKEELGFVYCELMKYNEQFVDKIKKAKDIKKLLKIWEEMKAKSFLNYNVDIKKFNETIDEFKKLPFTKQQRTLFDLLNKNQLYVNLSEIKDKEFKVGEGDKKINKEFYR